MCLDNRAPCKGLWNLPRDRVAPIWFLGLPADARVVVTLEEGDAARTLTQPHGGRDARLTPPAPEQAGPELTSEHHKCYLYGRQKQQ